ncbi:MAG: hypothetical protein JRD93_14060 [Deltaproteobacteria bacterium]|nr:hypothetical protein [Deltaproteobacteria bacterium]
MSEEYTSNLYKEYTAQRNKLDDASLEAAGRYDRTVLTISTGALALSVTFIDKIASTPQYWTLFLLVPGWLFLLAAVIYQLLALSASHEATREQIEILDKQYSYYFSANEPAEAVRSGWEEPKNRYNSRVNFYNFVARVVLISGIVLILAFSAINTFYKYGENREQKQEASPSQTSIKNCRKGNAIQGKLHPPKRQTSATSTTSEERQVIEVVRWDKLIH